jgi:hypothetical protein
MATCHEHNLRRPLPGLRPFGLRVRLRKGDPFRRLIGEDWSREHWFETREQRDEALSRMSERYVYFRPGDQPALDFERLDPAEP